MTIDFLIHLHIVMVRDVKNVRKIMNQRKKTFSTKNGSYHLNRFCVIVSVNVVKDLGKRYISNRE